MTDSLTGNAVSDAPPDMSDDTLVRVDNLVKYFPV